MRLVVKRNDQIVNEFQFDRGPVYIGRHAHSQVFLTVSGDGTLQMHIQLRD